MSAAPGARTVHVEHCMGTVFTIDVRDPGSWDAAIADVVAWLHHVDAVFSTYRDESDISRIRRGALAVEDADPSVGFVLGLCLEVEAETDGCFSPYYGGALDPTGLVKGWAIEEASHRLRHHGSHNHGVNGGGDIQFSGEAAPGRPWTVGVLDPFDGTRVLTTVSGRDFAVATSGTAERGQHIVDPRTGEAAAALASVTVVGESLTGVDAYATAAFAMGPAALSWIGGLAGHDALVVHGDGTTAATPTFHRPAGRPRLVAVRPGAKGQTRTRDGRRLHPRVEAGS